LGEGGRGGFSRGRLTGRLRGIGWMILGRGSRSWCLCSFWGKWKRLLLLWVVRGLQGVVLVGLQLVADVFLAGDVHLVLVSIQILEHALTLEVGARQRRIQALGLRCSSLFAMLLKVVILPLRSWLNSSLIEKMLKAKVWLLRCYLDSSLGLVEHESLAMTLWKRSH